MECSNQSTENGAAIKKEKDARKSPRKEKVDVKSEKVARKSPSKEKVKVDAKEWIKQFRKRRSELMLQSPKKGHVAHEVQT